jgi:DtxR family Mn-dependent transcriptional regulator
LPRETTSNRRPQRTPFSASGSSHAKEKTRAPGWSVSREDYLKAIWELEQDDQAPISARLAEELEVTPPAVTAALKRMTRDGLLRIERSGYIRLTRKGRSEAERLALRHQLAEKLLTDVLGLGWTLAHAAAERLEHGLSPEVEELLIRRFGADSACPHGMPLRGGLARLKRTQNAVPLADVPVGRTVEILAVYEKDPRFLEFLDARKLRPGVRIRVLHREYDETTTVSVAGHKAYLGKPATARIWGRIVNS